MHSLALLTTLLPLASAHFKLNNPPSIHFKDSTEDQAPCGGADLNDLGDAYDFHVGGESISTSLTHERSDWLYRVTTDLKADGEWEQIFPIFTQSGLGSFCQPKVTVNESYVGKKALLSVVSAATDGTLYQCAYVNFVKGTGEEYSKCSNGSANGNLSDNDKLSALVGDNVDSGSSQSSATKSDTKETGSSEGSNDDDEDDAAPGLMAWGWMSSLITVGAMAAAGGAMLG